MFVRVEPSSQRIYPFSSSAIHFSKRDVFGLCPIATKRPFVKKMDSSSVLLFQRRSDVRFCPSPSTSRISVFHEKDTFEFFFTRSCMIFEARSSSRRTTTVILSTNRLRNNASSIAASPPPLTTISFPRKKNPSHVAQAETPRP